MYADHHVVEVRRLLFELPGVEEVYASSSFHVLEVDYNDAAIDVDVIKGQLAEAGYLGELPTPVEVGADAAEANGRGVFFRHTAAFVQTGKSVGFTQQVPFSGRPLWPCPGLGAIENKKE
jgi:hypothetical protein